MLIIDENIKNKLCCIITDITENIKMTREEILNILEDEINKTIEEGQTIFILGLSNQIDMGASNLVLEFKYKNKNLRLVCTIPYFGYEEQFDFLHKCLFFNIIREADHVVYISEKDNINCISIRDSWMIEHSTKVITIK